MNYGDLVLIVLLQLLLIAGAYAALRVAARKGVLPEEIASTITHRDLSDYLQQEIDRTRAAIAHPPGELPDAPHMLNTRLGYLQAERRALNSSRRDPGHFWRHLSTSLVLPDRPEAVPVAAPGKPETGRLTTDSEKQMLRDLVETYEARVDALELFRDQFFDLREQLDSIQQKHRDLQKELDRVLPRSQRTEELERINQALMQEKESLEQKLLRLSREEESSQRVVTRNRDRTSTLARMERVGLEVAALDNHAETQQQLLSDLKQQARDSEKSSAEILRMVQQIEQLEHKLQQIRSESQKLREENERLQRELRTISTTAKTKEAALDDYRETVDDLKGLVVEQKERIRGMNEEMTTLATQAQEAEKLQQMIQDFTTKNSEMLMCIYTLEDENDFLRKQISELLKLDQSASTNEIEKAARKVVDSDTIQNQIIELETELEKKTDAYAKLQKKFMDMERKYLELYQKTR